MRKYYKLGTSDYEFVAPHDHYVVFVKDKDGKLVKRITEYGALENVVKVEPITPERITEIFNSPDMYLCDTEPTRGRSLRVMETIDNYVSFRGFVAHKDRSIRLNMDQHAKDVLASAKEGISFLKDLPALKNKSFR